MNYRFFANRVGTFWYHGHYNEQYPNGLYGALIVEDDDETTFQYAALGASYVEETELIIADFYNSDARVLASAYMTSSSYGLEPVPDEIVVNNMFTKTMQINVNKNQPIRIRVINGAPLSMFDVSVDGMPLKVIEVDGFPVQPQEFSYFRIDAGQRVSFILDWSKLDPTLSTMINIPLKVQAVKEMYRQFDLTDTTAYGLYGSTTKSKFYLTWVGQFTFSSSGVNTYYYYGVSISTPSTAPAPLEYNLLEMKPLFVQSVPSSDLTMDYNISFATSADGVWRFYVNGATYSPPRLSSPQLFDYMMPQGGPLQEPANLPKYSVIQGSGASPFVLPYNRTVTVTIRNTDGAAHPIHLHGHNFWVIATNQYTPSAPIKRDVVSVMSQGWAKIRFIANNPGVWLLHCHIDWHMVAGFMSTLVEAPSKIKNTMTYLPADHKAACSQYFAPTSTPTQIPTLTPITGTRVPTKLPSSSPTVVPTVIPSAAPVKAFVSNDPYALDWKTYGYDIHRSGINPTETKINSASASKMKRIWQYQLGGSAYMQPVIVLNYDFGTNMPTRYSRRRLQEVTTCMPSASPSVEPSDTQLSKYNTKIKHTTTQTV